MKEKKYDIRMIFSTDQKTYDLINLIAAKKKCSNSEILRELVNNSLQVNALNANMDLIAEIVRNEILTALKPSVERLASLEAKTCMASATAMYLSAEALEKFVAPTDRVQMQEAYSMARKKAASYTRGKEDGKKEKN